MTHRKKKFTVYGNCQAPALAKFLEHYESFAASYEYVEIKPVHIMTDKDIQEFYDLISEMDLLIYQPVSSNYRNNPMFGYRNILNKLQAKCLFISFPSCFFSGYYPELVCIKNTPAVFTVNNRKTNLFQLHDRNIIKHYLEHKTIEEVEDIIANRDFYSFDFLASNFQRSIAALKSRELDHNIDIPISGFIENKYKKLRLFHMLNHPSQHLLEYIADEILGELQLGAVGDCASDPLYRIMSVPLYPATLNQLGLVFADIDHYMVRGQVMTKREVIKTYYEGYKNIDRNLLENAIANWNPY